MKLGRKIPVADRLKEHSYHEPSTGCWIWVGSKTSDGYAQIWFGGKICRANRVSYETFVGPTNGLHVCHSCDNPVCVRLDHLFLGTDADNVADKCSKGRASGGSMSGEKHPGHILTTEQVIEIKSTPVVRGTVTSLASKFGVDKTTISRILRGKTWKKVV